MKILWLFLIIHSINAYVQPGFGTSYLRHSRLCEQWSCLNAKLGLNDSLPTAAQFGTLLRSLLPTDWHSSVDSVLNVCYNDRPRRYTNTCAGQAILHCAVDQLIANCPESNQRKEDACAPINSLAGFKYMFTQSRYENLERNKIIDRRPEWFLKNYFNTKCCNLPPLFNSTILAECGFSNIMQYYVHNPTILSPVVFPLQKQLPTTTPPSDGDSLQVVSLKDFLAGNTPITTDPLDCCNISKFIQPTWRQECNFEVSWSGQNRLVIKKDVMPTTTTEMPSTSRPVVRKDVTIVPQSCEKETCVFTNLNIITNGSVDIDAFTRLLDNLTSSHPSWTKSKGRVLTTCLRKPITEYDDICEINKILSCTFDVLTENCPNTTKNDLCKHTMTERTCQISSSKYRPKHRREICPLPELVERSILTECGLTSLSNMKPVNTIIKPKTYRLLSSQNKCQDLTPSTSCLLSKMGVLNKYGFLDYFKMKDRIRNYTAEISPLLESVYMSAFNTDLLYTEHCNSPKKLLNLLDSMLMTCPTLGRGNTAQCSTIFNQINNSPVDTNVSPEYSQRILNHFYHVYNPSALTPKLFLPRHIRKIKKVPLYHYGILNDKNAPKVKTINVKPKLQPKVQSPQILVEKPPLVLLPVYMRVPHSNVMIKRPFLENGILRNNFPLINPINNAQIYSLPSSVSTTQSISNLPNSTHQLFSTTEGVTTQPVSTTKHFSSRFVTSKPKKML